ncbi:histidine kinase N-terminal 7TM domain-containing protein [Halorientalis salina]|uniref:histidine kinase N-terminal 7TM domain-containing protein n=1 Tax=Halorientalis salina TaxID=2932266 RepID=UPI0010AB55C2|nr:histidine kinase N-terminal 7TM domain-containing protein [Halorientalis salina]
MSVQALLFQAVLVVAGLLSVGVATYAWRNRERRGAKLLVGVLVSVFFWILMAGVASVFSGTPVAKSAARLWYVGVTGSVLCLFLLALRYTGREEYISRRSVALLLIEPVFINVAAWVPPMKESFMAFGAPDPATFIGYATTMGPLFHAHTAYSYALLTASAIMLVSFAFRSEALYQRQVVAILVAVFAPWIGNALYLFGPITVDLTPVSFAVTGLALWWAIFSEDFLEIVPVARSTVVDNVGAGVFVLDREDKLVDINPAGREMLGLEGTDVIGKRAQTLLASHPAVRDRFENVDDMEAERETEVSFGASTYQVEISPLYDQRDTFIGRLFLVHDVTDQKRRQRELERQNDQLEQFANVVSHDLRNPLNVASAKLELGLVKDEREHFEDVQDAHERMSRIIEDVLTLAREGQGVDERTRVRLRSLARRAWDNVETTDAELRVTGDREFEADEQRLLRVFENLFRNALEHGRDDATVTVGPTEEGFYVADDGQGIPDEHGNEVFEDGFTTNEDGTGFGLSIVQNIVEAHGWEISVTDSESRGARFEVTGIAPLVDQASAS